MSELREYWAFISYRHLDNLDRGREWATWITREIETYEVPADLVGTTSERGEIIPERLYPVFRDEDELSAGADLSSPIYQALRDSKSLVVICSPQAIGSRYVGNEISYYKSLDPPCGALAMMIEGEPHAGDQRECFPDELKHPVDSDGKLDTSRNVEPVAADFRLPNGCQGWHSLEECRRNLADEATVTRYRDQCELAKLKIIAGILGVPLGQLVERDKAYQLTRAKRRARLITQVATVMALLAALATAAGIFAWKKREQAILAQATAEHAKGSAEELIQEMLFNMDGKLSQFGRLDLLDDVSRSAENYFANLPSADIDDLSERNRSVMLDSRARILLATGDLQGSLEKYQQALSIARQLLAQHPDSPKNQEDLVISLKNVADILVQQNRSAEADRFYLEAATIMTGLLEEGFDDNDAEYYVASLLGENGPEKNATALDFAKAEPAKIDILATAATIFQGRAIIKAQNGEFADALAMHQFCLSIQNALAIADTDNANSRIGRISSLSSIGDLHQTLGDVAAAQKIYQQMAKLVEAEIELNPVNAKSRDLLAASFSRLSAVASTGNQPVEGLEFAQRAREIWQELSATDPSNLARLRNHYVGVFRLGLAQIANNDPTAARKSFTDALNLARRLFEADPGNASWRVDLAFCLERQGSYLIEDGDYEKGNELLTQAIAHHRHLADQAPANLAKRTNLLHAVNRVAGVHYQRQEWQAADQHYRESENIARSVVEDLAAPTLLSRNNWALVLMYLAEIADTTKRYQDAVTWNQTLLDLVIESRDKKLISSEEVAAQIAQVEATIAKLREQISNQ